MVQDEAKKVGKILSKVKIIAINMIWWKRFKMAYAPKGAIGIN
jgi:hypothetical protein